MIRLPQKCTRADNLSPYTTLLLVHEGRPAESAKRTALSASATPATVAVFEARRFDRALDGSVVPAKQWQRIDELDALLEQVNALYAQAGKEIEQAREQGHSDRKSVV